ncbi:structural maintenance of chromosomes protein 6-like isoform X1 [Mya arenaria]|uniref:structural maintenance of chromosomes protein 6-like isoform X1 n=1 Tax=Mya arenaria TaxID=6604 RepID=UPI0022E4D992|nr:structural maintenance of chromosomes protein 6-like isoform X1 [Mya arenaria]
MEERVLYDRKMSKRKSDGEVEAGQKARKKARSVAQDEIPQGSEDETQSMSRQEAPSQSVGEHRSRNRSRARSVSQEEAEVDDSVMDLSQNPGFKVKGDEMAQGGIIEKIHMRNFMCHPKLTITFGPNINFIVGRNGSGKSAVVNALVVGLGGKASSTNRGSKMKGFILTGKQTAEVEIKLRNQGPDAFQPDLYGPSVIVNRKFNNSGSSEYKLKSSDGRVISTKKEELSRLLDQFNIQVENPLAILNQETSKSFLNSKSPNDKYKFFLKATQLEQIKEDYDRANDHKNITTEIINQKVEQMPKLEKEVLTWERKFKSLTAIDDLKVKIKRLNHELAWSLVQEKEKGMEPLARDRRHEEARLPSFKQKVEEAKHQLDDVNARMSAMTARLSKGGEEVKALQPKLQEAKNSYNEQKKVSRNCMMELKRLEGAVKNSKKEKHEIMKRILEIQSSANHDYEAERQARQDKIAALQERLNSLNAQEQTTDHMLDQYRGAVAKYKSDQYKLNQDMQDLQRQMDKKQGNLTSLKAAQGNQLKRFGPFIPDLVTNIEQCFRHGRFHKKPIGPLGSCFTLKEQRWALAVECCLKGLMNSWVCHDYHDEKILEQIVKDVCPQYKISIIVSRFKNDMYDTSAKGADNSQFPSVLDMVQSDDPMVYNTMIDMRTIECVLLIEDGKTARQVMDPSKRPPRNAREAFTKQGDQVYCAPTFRYYSSSQDKARLLTSNVEEDIASLTLEIAGMRQKIEQLRQTRTQFDTDIQENTNLDRKTSTQLMKIREAQRKVTMEITELKNIEDPAPVDVATYEEEVDILDKQIQDNEAQLANKTILYREQEAQLKDLEKVFKQIEQSMKEKIGIADVIKDEVGTILSEVETCKVNKKHYDTKLKELERRIKDINDRMDKYQADIEADIEKAKEIHEERINTRRSSNNIGNEIAQIEKQIKNEEKQRGDPVEITRQYKEKKDAFMKIRKEVHQLKTFCERLDNAVGRRLTRYSEFRRLIALRTKFFFASFLNNRAYTGKMTFNHKDGSLEMIVQPSKSASGESTKDLRSLSGGERSFSTICFILALWGAMDSPFRCLDEFDVFMDMVNRRIAMEMLMGTAKEQQERQFIFLSPLKMCHLGISTQNMRIFEMPTPERGQQTLDD